MFIDPLPLLRKWWAKVGEFHEVYIENKTDIAAYSSLALPSMLSVLLPWYQNMSMADIPEELITDCVQLVKANSIVGKTLYMYTSTCTCNARTCTGHDCIKYLVIAVSD